jgi:phosphatidylinositol alpha 1,6-mannosyltransferase
MVVHVQAQAGRGLRILVAAETFLPTVNGVTNSVVRILDHLERRGHEAVVIAPAPGPNHYGEVPVVRVPSRELPLYRTFPVGLPSSPLVEAVLDRFRPDVVHLAAPVVLGARVAAAASARDLPVVAVFQTDLPGFAKAYGLSAITPVVWWWLRRIHRLADVTLAPSTAVATALHAQGIPRVGVWGRGVDRRLFRPDRFSPNFRRSVLGDRYRTGQDGPILVGYVGRLAREKEIDRLAHLCRIPEAQLVIVGDGPERGELERQLPGAHFTGMLRGPELAEAVASLDVFVHTGAHETFGQAIQEAMASAVPVVAPAAGGPLDLVVPGETGLLHHPGDSRAMVEAVLRLVADRHLRCRMGDAGRVRTATRTWEQVNDELLATYHRCRELRRPPGQPHPAGRPEPVAAAGGTGR